MDLKKLCLAALAALVVMALVGAGTASASEPKAEPEGGIFPDEFIGSGGSSLLETVAEGTKIRKVHCTENTSVGEIDSATTAKNVEVTFKGCTAEGPFGSNVNCTTPKKFTGEITTTTLKGTFVYTKSGSSEAGILLQPVSGNFAEFTCGGVQSLVVSGSVIGKLTPVNTLTRTYTLTFSQKAGKQEPETYLANSGCAATKAVLSTAGTKVFFPGETFNPIQSGIEGDETLTLSKNVKINSTSCA